jgi:energy-coupling factor transporter ATP-binding protein EcfA2
MAKVLIAGKEQYYAGYLLKVLEEIQKMLDKDNDCIAVVDGKTGSGKSTLAQSLAAYIDPEFNIERVCFDTEDFKKSILTCPKRSAIIFDEALGGLNIRRTMSSINVMLTGLLTEIRQKNLFILLCLPSIFDLDKSIGIHRSTFLCHVVTKNGKRGYFQFYGMEAKKRLFSNTMARRSYQYFGRPSFWGRFTHGYFVDELAYRKKKSDVLKRYFPVDTTPELSPDDMVKQREAEIFKKLKDYGIPMTDLAKAGIMSRQNIYARLKTLQRNVSVGTSILNNKLQPEGNFEIEQE